MTDDLERKLRELIEHQPVFYSPAIAALARAVLAYRDYVHKDQDTEEIDAELLKALQ